MYSALRFETPQLIRLSWPSLMICCGTSFGQAATMRCHIDCADTTEICWPTTERASVTNGSARLDRCTGPNFGISFFRMRSRLTRSAQALSQYAGRVTTDDCGSPCTACSTSVDDTAARGLRT